MSTLRERAQNEATSVELNKLLKAKEEELKKLKSLNERLVEHLDWIGWGDSYERECSQALREEVRGE